MGADRLAVHVAEYLGGVVMIALMALALRLFVPARLEARAREHAQSVTEDGHDHHHHVHDQTATIATTNMPPAIKITATTATTRPAINAMATMAARASAAGASA